MSDDLATLTVVETAELLGVGVRTLREAIRNNEFPPARRVGRRVVIPVRALAAWMDGDEIAAVTELRSA